ncbi:MAG: bifunctional DNA primase/polymerase [Methanomicrobiaceae archaeon]|nr:bifunctional DNA primase/polymerase [Methanomicrobiaceae archaeon]
MTIEIPEQIRDCIFIKVKTGDKAAIEPGWQKDHNYAANALELIEHLKAGGNYGVMPTGGVCILDADNAMTLMELGVLDSLSDTFFVRTGGDGFRGHFYFRCPGFPDNKKLILYHPETGEELGDIRPSGCRAYCVGPSSIHPSGKPYEIGNGSTLKSFTYTDIRKNILSKVKTSADKKEEAQQQVTERIPDHIRGSGSSLVDRLGLTVTQFMMPLNPRPRENQIEGEHPVHGSDTGTNYIVDPMGNKWYCRRHGTGGGPLEALAVAEKIIDCSEAGKGCLQGHWPAIFDALKKWGYSSQLAEIETEKQQALQKKEAASRIAHDVAPEPEEPAPETSETEGETVVPPVPDVQVSSWQLLPVKSCVGEGFDLTDAGNSDRLVHQYGDVLRYCVTFKSWYIWDSLRWRRDELNEILAIATMTARSIMIEAAHVSEEKFKWFAKWGMNSQSLAKREAMIRGATPYVAVTPDKFDSHPSLINLKNCTLDLVTLQAREPDKKDLMTKCMNVVYVPDAKCPLWEKHLETIFDGDRELIDGFQEICGYSLLGDNPEQQIFFLYGTGKNGKSETTKVLSRIFGEYAINIAAESLMVKRGEAPRSDIARMAGARLVTASEAYEGARLAESVIKQLTGDDRVTVRRLYENEFSFRPEAKIFMATNHKPRITGVDDGIWRRIQLWPFTIIIPPEKRVANYGDVLLQEASGILNWCLEGFRRYQTRGTLEIPDAVQAATKDYRTESDSVRSFLTDETMESPDGTLSRKELYEAYEAWCNALGETPATTKKVAQIMKSTSYVYELTRGGNRMWKGLRWKTSDEKDQEVRDQMEVIAQRMGVSGNA